MWQKFLFLCWMVSLLTLRNPDQLLTSKVQLYLMRVRCECLWCALCLLVSWVLGHTGVYWNTWEASFKPCVSSSEAKKKQQSQPSSANLGSLCRPGVNHLWAVLPQTWEEGEALSHVVFSLLQCTWCALGCDLRTLKSLQHTRTLKSLQHTRTT